MKRLSKYQKTLSVLDDLDYQFVVNLSHSRGCFTRNDYQRYRGISRQAAAVRLRNLPLATIFKSLLPDCDATAPEIMWLDKKYAFYHNRKYEEPKTFHNAADGILRFKFQVSRTCLGWVHNLRGPSTCSLNGIIVAFDCLDRSEQNVISTHNQSSVTKMQLVTGSKIRYKRFKGLAEGASTRSKSLTPISHSPTFDEIFENLAPNSIRQEVANTKVEVLKVDHYLFSLIDKYELAKDTP